MGYLIYIFRIYLIITIHLSLISLPIAMAGKTFYSILKKKGYKLPWMYIPGLCFYPFFTMINREFKLFGFIKIKSRKAVAIYYLLSSVVLVFICLWDKFLLSTLGYSTSGPITLYTNLHFISLILFIIQFIIFQTKANYDLFIICQMADTAFPLALLSVFFPLVLPIIVINLDKKGRLVLLEEPTPAANQIS